MRNVAVDIEMNVPPQKVIEAFVYPDMLRDWWGVERSYIELKPGGVYILNWGISDAGIKYISSGIIVSHDPLHHVHIDRYMYINPERPILGPLQLRIDAEPVSGGCHVRLTQGPYPEHAGPHWDWYFEVVRDVWPVVLKDLKKYLEETSVL